MEKLKKVKETTTNKVTPVTGKVTSSTHTSELSNFCEVCCKTFGSLNKLNEHMASKAHKLRCQQVQEKSSETNLTTDKAKKVKVETAETNHLICFVCNEKNKDMDGLLSHLKTSHQFEFPVFSCLKKVEKAVKLIIKKIFKFGACLYCDSQRFPSPKAIQCHMKDTGHIKISYEDILEHFYKYYDSKKILLVTGEERKTKEFKLLKKIVKANNKKKELKEDEIEEVDEIDENQVIEEDVVEEVVETKKKDANKQTEEEDEDSDEDDIEDINYVTLENGEIMLRDGTVLGNKVYKDLYKQRVNINSSRQTGGYQTALTRLKAKSTIVKANKKKFNKEIKAVNWKLHGSNKSNFIRINSLHIVRKQVNC